LCNHLQFADLARHPLLAGSELVDVARHPFLPCRELLDVARYLLLSDGDPVDGLAHRIDSNRYCVLTGRGRSLRSQPDRVASAVRNRRGARRQRAKLRMPLRDDLSGRVALGLPGQGGSYSATKRDQNELEARHDIRPDAARG
jgi:hypothetical protein